MVFIQPCFIRKNTPELRKKLEELGYTNTPNGRGEWFIPIEELKYLVTYPISGYYQGCNGYWYEDDFDCGTNEELFLALAALRDDSDKNQYFICDKVSFTIGKTYYPDDYLYYQYDEFFDKQNWHKATVEELIEHFKKE
jgi:hypothetical protein